MRAVQGIDAQSQYSLGHLLLSFLDCFGNTFDYKSKAVSVRAVSLSACHTRCFLCSAALIPVAELSPGCCLLTLQRPSREAS